MFISNRALYLLLLNLECLGVTEILKLALIVTDIAVNNTIFDIAITIYMKYNHSKDFDYIFHYNIYIYYNKIYFIIIYIPLLHTFNFRSNLIIQKTI